MSIVATYYQNPDGTYAVKRVCDLNGTITTSGWPEEGATVITEQEYNDGIAALEAARQAHIASAEAAAAQAAAEAAAIEAAKEAARVKSGIYMGQMMVAEGALTVEEAELLYNVELP